MELESLSPTRVQGDYELDPKTIREAYNRGELKASEVKRKLYVKRTELERWIESQESKRRKGVS